MNRRLRRETIVNSAAAPHRDRGFRKYIIVFGIPKSGSHWLRWISPRLSAYRARPIRSLFTNLSCRRTTVDWWEYYQSLSRNGDACVTSSHLTAPVDVGKNNFAHRNGSVLLSRNVNPAEVNETRCYFRWHVINAVEFLSRRQVGNQASKWIYYRGYFVQVNSIFDQYIEKKCLVIIIKPE